MGLDTEDGSVEYDLLSRLLAGVLVLTYGPVDLWRRSEVYSRCCFHELW